MSAADEARSRLTARVELDGDLLELQDHRNWTDANGSVRHLASARAGSVTYGQTTGWQGHLEVRDGRAVVSLGAFGVAPLETMRS